MCACTNVDVRKCACAKNFRNRQKPGLRFDVNSTLFLSGVLSKTVVTEHSFGCHLRHVCVHSDWRGKVVLHIQGMCKTFPTQSRREPSRKGRRNLEGKGSKTPNDVTTAAEDGMERVARHIPDFLAATMPLTPARLEPHRLSAPFS